MTYEVRRVSDETTLADAYAVRRAVFIEEQDVSEDEEYDGLDDRAIHFVAYAVGPDDGRREHGEETASDGPPGRPVGTARLRIPEPGLAKPERVAVLESHRGEGVGRRLMHALEREARDQGCERARLHAQVPVEEFYRALGYETTSGVFEEAGIPHVEMAKEL